MKRRTVLAGSLAAGLAPLGILAQEATPVSGETSAQMALAIRWEVDAFAGGDVEILRELASPNYLPPYAGYAPGVDALVQRAVDHVALLNQFDEYSTTVDKVIESGRFVALLKTVSATSDGRMASFQDPSWFEFGPDGLIVSVWSASFVDALANELGLD